METYEISYNGEIPFVVEIYRSKNTDVLIYDNGYDEETDGTKDEFIMELDAVKEVFIGKSPENDGNNGNSILVNIRGKNYMYIGRTIELFSTPEPVIDYVSPVGNNDVPYPYAITANRIYLMNEKMYLEIDEIEDFLEENPSVEFEDPYDFYYGHFIKKVSGIFVRNKQKKRMDIQQNHMKKFGHPFKTKKVY